MPVESSYNNGNFPQPEVAVKRRHAHGVFAIWTLLLVLVSSPRAQEPLNSVRVGLPQDWTQHHIVFSRDALMKNPGLIYSEPRVLHEAVQRWQSTRPQILSGADLTAASVTEPQRDWNVALGLGRVAPNMFPAKYSFDPGAPPSCANDFVVFGLNHVGVTGGQANLVGFNNLYAGAGPGLCGAARGDGIRAGSASGHRQRRTRHPALPVHDAFQRRG